MSEPLINITGSKILVVDDLPANLTLLVATLESADYAVYAVTNGSAALDVAVREKPDLILLDIAMPDMDGFDVCRCLKENVKTKDIPVIFLTAYNDVEKVVAGFQIGAVDYIVKPFHQDEVLIRIRTQLERKSLMMELQNKNQVLENEIEQRKVLNNRLAYISKREEEQWGITGFIGQSPTMKEILREIALLKDASDTSVLILGESGTGKEHVARAIHAGSARSKGSFITVNCAAIPNELAESLLFGHHVGAFTGAKTAQIGYFAMADGGTLFLDEIGSMPVSIQPKLLRVLEDGLIRPLGAKFDKKVNVRILAATNEPRESFRDDLYFRLARFTVEVPPLRKRKDDIPLLAQHFLRLFAEEFGKGTPHFEAAAIEHLNAYDFPGNVRELKNMVERAVLESNGADITPQHLHKLSHTKSALSLNSSDDLVLIAMPLNLAEAETLLIERALEQSNGNVSAAASLLGIDRHKIYRKLKKTAKTSS